VEYEEALKTGTVVCKTTSLVHDGIDHLLPDGVMTASIYGSVNKLISSS
jgi:hypothetical protein